MKAASVTARAPLVDPDLRIRYETFSSMLGKNGTALKLLADLEADLNHVEPTDDRLLVTIDRLVRECMLMAQELNLLTGDRHRCLYDVITRIDARIRLAFASGTEAKAFPLSIRLREATPAVRSLVGGKAAGLIDLERRFADLIPDGFVITSAAYSLFVEENGLLEKIRILLEGMDSITHPDLFGSRTEAIRSLIARSPVPERIREDMDTLASVIDAGPAGWAVRSSARSEDGTFSFAGQFDSLLNVKTCDLVQAYRSVLAGRFTDRAVRYRIHCGFCEVETPMAVLFVPMIEPVAAGVTYTRNPRLPGADEMLVSAVPGLADGLVKGNTSGDEYTLGRHQDPDVLRGPSSGCMDDAMLRLVGNTALAASEFLGRELDIEWALDRGGRLWLLQARELRMEPVTPPGHGGSRQAQPIIERGVTVSPGRAEGRVELVDSVSCFTLSHEAPVMVTDLARVELSPCLPRIAALLVRDGSPVGHLATLVRELSVPAIFQVGPGVGLLEPDDNVSVNASLRRVYRGTRWPGIRARVLERVAAGKRSGAPHGHLHDLVLALNLIDPYASSFKAKSCSSLHDVVRFVHEMSIRAMFALGDSRNRFWRRGARKLVSSVPVRLNVIALDGSISTSGTRTAVSEVDSVPFKALFRGMTDPRVTWSERRFDHLDYLPSDFVEQVMGGTRGPRRRGSANYAMVTHDYMNLNARLVFHYLMVDALVRPGKDGNHVHFRARGGGGSDLNRERRARFMELVLRNMGFVVDRRLDLVTAWFRGAPLAESENALVRIGMLMACARQLDMLMTSDSFVPVFVDRFLAGDFSAFS